MTTTRFMGEKSSIIPWIIGAILLALIGVGTYAYFQNKDKVDKAVSNTTSSISSTASSQMSQNSASSVISSGASSMTGAITSFDTVALPVNIGKSFEIKDLYVVDVTGDRTFKVSEVNIMNSFAVYAYAPYNITTVTPIALEKLIKIKGTVMAMPSASELTEKWGLKGEALTDAQSYATYLMITDAQ